MSIAAINTRNQFRGRVTHIRRGPVVCEVEITTPMGLISALVTTSSLEGLGLELGNEAAAMFKATDVLIAKLA